jgi:integrase/recombinase XerD
MLEDMTVRNFGWDTQRNYIRAVKKLTVFLGRSPDTATAEDLRLFQLHLTSTGRPPANHQRDGHGAALLLQRNGRPGRCHQAADVRRGTAEDPHRAEPRGGRALSGGGTGAKYKAALSAAYGAGLRVSEVARLKVCDSDCMRMLLRIEQGKGRKDPFAMLSPQLLELLRDWWRIARPRVWLFPGQNPVNHLTTHQLNRAVHAAAHMAEITKRVTPHTLRHSFATHLLEQNINIRVIQVLLLGHAKLDTAALYTRVATNTIRVVMSPLDRLTPVRSNRAEPPA